MLVLPQTVKMKWNKNPKQREYYINKGYKFTKCLDEFEVNVLDLPENSTQKVWVICDYCGKRIQKTYSSYNKSKKNSVIKKDCCDKCQPNKYKETNLIKYGVENSFQRENVKEKIKHTIIEKYGVENISQSEKIKNKKIETVRKNLGVDYPTQSEIVIEKRRENCLEKYGVENPAMLKEVQEKMKRTIMLKYGVEHYSQTNEYKEKYKNTSILKYGTEHPFQNSEVRKKCLITSYKNGTFICSEQQYYIYKIIEGELNYPVNNFVLDIAFPNEKIYVEYDGSGHDLSVRLGTITQSDFEKREMIRSKILRRQGWKEIRIISKNDYLPNKEIIIKMIDYAKNYFQQNHSWIKFDIDEGLVITSSGTSPFYFGEILPINKLKEAN